MSISHDDIVVLAKQAGFLKDGFGIGIWDSQDFNEFAQLVANKVREECAQIAAEWDETHPHTNYGKCIATDIRTRNKL